MTTMTKQQQVEQLRAAKHAFNATGEMLFNGDIHPSIIVMALLHTTAVVTSHFFQPNADKTTVQQLGRYMEEERARDATHESEGATAH